MIRSPGVVGGGCGVPASSVGPPSVAAAPALRWAIAGLQKIAVIGAGSVGVAVAYASMIDRRRRRDRAVRHRRHARRAEVLDLSHGLQFVGGGRVNGGDDVAVCAGADLVVVTAGAAHGPGGTRLDLAGGQRRPRPRRPAAAARRRARRHLPARHQPGRRRHVRRPGDLAACRTGRVIGSGTVLDTSRLRHLLAERLGVAVTACTPWSSASTATARSCCGRRRASAARRCSTSSGPTADGSTADELDALRHDVRTAAAQIIAGQGQHQPGDRPGDGAHRAGHLPRRARRAAGQRAHRGRRRRRGVPVAPERGRPSRRAVAARRPVGPAEEAGLRASAATIRAVIDTVV